jgi:hypothetical protein
MFLNKKYLPAVLVVFALVACGSKSTNSGQKVDSDKSKVEPNKKDSEESNDSDQGENSEEVRDSEEWKNVKAKTFSATDSLVPNELKGVWKHIRTGSGYDFVKTEVRLEFRDGLMFATGTCSLEDESEVATVSVPVKYTESTIEILEDNKNVVVSEKLKCNSSVKKDTLDFEINEGKLYLFKSGSEETERFLRE